MIAHQRLIGNIAGRGHGDPLLSPAFPLDCELATAVNYRLPDVGQLPAQVSRLSDDGKFHILVTTFELQATHFGRAMLISSGIFRPSETNGPVRPTMYMNTVAMTDETGAPLAFLPPEELLLYRDFITPTQFVTLNASTKVLPSAPFEPSAAPQRRAFFAPNTAAHRALLSRYWSAASTRLFGETQQGKGGQGFSVCLGPQCQCAEIIEDAKALLLNDILRYLPPAVRHIASLSAGAPQASTRNVFKDSALVVVFPTVQAEPNQPAFDLRTEGRYPQIAALDDQFISAVLAGQTALMDDAVARCMRLMGWDDPARVSFSADYDFALLLYQLEQTVLNEKALLSPAQCVSAWRMLNMLLLNRHHFTVAQSNAIFEGVENRLMTAFARSGALLDAIDASALPALWQKALSVSDELFPRFCDVIAASPAASEFPRMVTMYANIGEQGQRRSATLIQRITAQSYAKRPFDAALVAALTEEAFSSVADKQPPVSAALREGLAQNNASFPDNLLVTLPLAHRLPQGERAFEDALGLLDSRYTRELPAQPLLENLRDACARFGNDNSRARLCDYFAACLPAYARDPGTLATAAASVLPRADGVLTRILEQSARSGLLFAAPQMAALLSPLLPACDQPERIGALYTQLESDLSHRLSEAPLARLDRLCALSAHLRAMGYDATGAASDILAAFAQSHQLLSPEQAEAFVSGLWPLCADRGRAVQAFQTYLTAIVADNPLYYFEHSESLRSLAPFIRAAGTDMTPTLCGILEACAGSNPTAPLERVSVLVGELQPLCRDSARTTDALLRYAEASRRSCEQRSEDGFAWLQGFTAIMGSARLLTPETQASLAAMAIDHLAVLYGSSQGEPSEQAYAWLEQLPAQSDLFARVKAPALALLNDLTAAPGKARAQKCFASLRGSLVSTADYPALRQLDQSLTCGELSAALASQPLDRALEAVRGPMQRCGLTQQALLGAVADDAEKALRRDFSRLKTPEDFSRARLAASPADARAMMHNRVLAAVFAERYPAFQKACASLDQLNRLNALAQQLGSPTAQTDTVSGQTRAILDLVNQPQMRFETFAAPFDECLRILRESQQSAPQICALLEEAVSRNLPQCSFPRSVLAAMLCSYSPQTDSVDWSHAFPLLGLKPGDKLPAPYSAQGQVWLAAIHAICRVLDAMASQRFASQFLDTLRSGPFADFTRSVQGDQKRLAYFFPEGSAASPLLRQWLGR